MPSPKLDKLQKKLSAAGVDVPLTASATPERDAVIFLRNRLKEHIPDPQEWAKLQRQLIKAEKEYALVFHTFIADKYPNLLFEKSEDKVYWIYNEDTGVYDEISFGVVRGIVMKELRDEGLKDHMTESFARNCLARYRGIFAERGKLYEDFDADDEWFHANNGWLRLSDRKFREHTPERLSRRKSAVDYHADATCPVYDKFLDTDVQLPEDAIRALNQFSGLLLTHDIRHQKMLTIVGKPGSGKSTLLDIWSIILGDLVTQNALTDFSGDKYRFMGSSLAGRTLCWFDEVEVKRAEMSSVLEKKITAREIEIERKGIDGTRYAPNYLKFILTANTLPLSAEMGIYRRLLIVEFNRSFTSDGTVDRELIDKLTAEAPGILNRMLRGLDDLRKMGTFTMIAGHDEMIEEYKASSNTVAEFLDTYFAPDFTMKSPTVSSEDLFTAYRHFMGKGHGGFTLTPQRFGRMLSSQPLTRFEHIVTARIHEGVRAWKGLLLKPDYEWDRDNDERGAIIKAVGGDDGDASIDGIF
jgi:P4 family phage/plasmid primase-like protien